VTATRSQLQLSAVAAAAQLVRTSAVHELTACQCSLNHACYCSILRPGANCTTYQCDVRRFADMTQVEAARMPSGLTLAHHGQPTLSKPRKERGFDESRPTSPEVQAPPWDILAPPGTSIPGGRATRQSPARSSRLTGAKYNKKSIMRIDRDQLSQLCGFVQRAAGHGTR
jgi:hypothetical protein